MATFIETLTKPNGDQIAPRTKTAAITNADGASLESMLADVQRATPLTVTIASTDWSAGGVATKNITGVTLVSNVLVEADNPAVVCTAQGNGTLTFTADPIPTVPVTVKVLLFKEAADAGKPIEVASAADMDNLLSTAIANGVVYKYTGVTTDSYENGTLYIVEGT